MPVRLQICPARGDGLQKLGEGGELLARDLVLLVGEPGVELQQQLVQLHSEDGERAVVITRTPRLISQQIFRVELGEDETRCSAQRRFKLVEIGTPTERS